MAKKSSKAYFGFGRLISIIFAIIPITSLIFGIITAAKNGSWLCVLLRVFLGWNIFWIIDLITVILSGKLILV